MKSELAIFWNLLDNEVNNPKLNYIMVFRSLCRKNYEKMGRVKDINIIIIVIAVTLKRKHIKNAFKVFFFWLIPCPAW